MNDIRAISLCHQRLRRLATPIIRGLLLLALELLFSVAVHAAAPLDPVRLQLKWQHQFQFAGYYAALEKGYYREAGLDVTIIPSRPGNDPVGNVLLGEAEFGVGTTDLLLLREKGEPVVALAVIFQHSPLALLVRRQAGIQTLHDLAGRKLMIEPGSAELFAYLNREGLSTDKFTLLPHDFNVGDLQAGKVDGMSVYVTDEPFELVKSRVEHQLYSPRAAGIDFYGDNLFTTEAQLKAHPLRVEAFRAASLKGWDYAMRHPEEIIELILARYGHRHSAEHLRFEASRMVALLRAELVEIGHMNPGRWRHIADVYAEQGMMKAGFDLGGFLYDPHPPPPDLTWLYVALAGLLTFGIAVGGVALYIHRVNRRLHSSEKRYREVYEYAPVAFIVTSRDYRITGWNRAAQAIFGWSREEALGRNMLGLLVAQEDITPVKQVLDSTFDERLPTHSINRNQTKNGESILCEWNNVLYSDEDGDFAGVLSLGMNITERHKLEEGLRQAKESAEQSLEDHRQFLAMVSHEFRSPLAIIESSSQVLELHADSAARPVLERIRRAVRRLTLFIDNYLNVERLDTSGWTPRLAPIDAAGMLEALVEQARQISSAHRITLECGATLESFEGDIQLLRVAVQNLLENAVKYSPGGGEIILRADIDAPAHVIISVTDHGIGIAEEDRDKIFAKFYRSPQVGRIPGAGLGLSLVARIVALHHGTIRVEGRPGLGASISIRLPAKQESV